MEAFLIGYLKAGLIGWGVWVVLSILYVLISFGLDISLYRDSADKSGDTKTKWTLSGIASLVLWPWGMVLKSKLLVEEVESRLKRKGTKSNGF